MSDNTSMGRFPFPFFTLTKLYFYVTNYRVETFLLSFKRDFIYISNIYRTSDEFKNCRYKFDIYYM